MELINIENSRVKINSFETDKYISLFSAQKCVSKYLSD